MLLDFTVANYCCYAEETTLDLTRNSLKTLTPREGSPWQEQTWRVAAIFGANASGKSTLLDALNCLHHAVGGQRDILYQPFSLDRDHATQPSRFSIGFTHENERYSYSVEAHRWGISREELWAAGQRWRKVFVRTQGSEDDEPTIESGTTLKGATNEVRRITTPKDLFLAVALKYKHATLAPIARSLRTMRFIHHSDEERSSLLRWVMIGLQRPLSSGVALRTPSLGPPILASSVLSSRSRRFLRKYLSSCVVFPGARTRRLRFPPRCSRSSSVTSSSTTAVPTVRSID